MLVGVNSYTLSERAERTFATYKGCLLAGKITSLRRDFPSCSCSEG